MLKSKEKKVTLSGWHFIKVMLTAIMIFNAITITDCDAADEILVPEDFASIQDAIYSAKDGDIILVSPGKYVERLYFPKKDVTVRSTSGPARTIIDGDGLGSVMVIDSGATSGTVIDGFTITNGKADSGGGLYIERSSPTIFNCIITGNSATDGGGIFCLDSASPIITKCVIADNTAQKGAGIFCIYSSTPEIMHSEISRNYASIGGGMFTTGSSSPLITKCDISDNDASWFGNWLFYFNSAPVVASCNIDGNTADYGDGAYYYLLHFLDILRTDKSTVAVFEDAGWYITIFELLFLKVCIFMSLKELDFDKWLEKTGELYTYNKDYSTSINEYLKSHV
jgi:hypothetical protein